MIEKCEHCGKRREEEWHFCPFCGRSLQEQQRREAKYPSKVRTERKLTAYKLSQQGLSFEEIADRIPALKGGRMSKEGVRQLIASGARIVRFREKQTVVLAE